MARKAPVDRRGSLGEGVPTENGALAALVSDLDQKVSDFAVGIDQVQEALQIERERQVTALQEEKEARVRAHQEERVARLADVNKQQASLAEIKEILATFVAGSKTHGGVLGAAGTGVVEVEPGPEPEPGAEPEPSTRTRR